MFVHELCFLSTWLWNVARGRSGDKVQGRVLPKSHSCSKTFAGPKSLKDMASVSIFFWPFHLLETMCSRHPPGVQTLDPKHKVAMYRMHCLGKLSTIGNLNFVGNVLAGRDG